MRGTGIHPATGCKANATLNASCFICTPAYTTILQFAQAFPNEQNQQALLLASSSTQSSKQDMPQIMATLRNKFDLVGVVPRLSAFLRRLSNLLQPPHSIPVDAATGNTASQKTFVHGGLAPALAAIPTDEQQVSQIMQLNLLDLHLYNFAEMLEARQHECFGD